MPKSALTLDQYAALKKRLSIVHKFSFATRKRFTPNQKAAITRAWKKYRSAVKALENGEALIVKASKRQIKKFPDKQHSNRGLILYEQRPSIRDESVEGVKEFKESLKIEQAKVMHGSYKDGLPTVYIPIKHNKTFEILLPIPAIDDLPAYARELVEIYNPSSVMMQMSGYHGRVSVPLDMVERYLTELVNKIDGSIKKYDTDTQPENVLTGIYLEFPNTKRYRKLWKISR